MCYVQSLQLCLTLFDSMNCSPPGSCVHGILQARTVEWVAISSSRGSSQPRDTLCLLYPPLIAQLVKKSTYNAGDPGSIPGLGRSPGEGIGYPLQYSWASLVAQLVKNPPAVWETWVWSLGWVGKIPWRRERLPTPVFWPGEFQGLYSPWSHRIRHDWATLTSLSCIIFIGRRFLYH